LLYLDLDGDEFACLLPDLLQLTIHASIGIAVCPSDGPSAEALPKSADEAMYRAKRQNTGYAFFAEGAAAGVRVSG
jgi:predicted signal transduction protein with EAL and GGDEF domain